MYNEKSRVRGGSDNRLRNFYDNPTTFEGETRTKSGNERGHSGKLGRLFSGDGFSSAASTLSESLSKIRDDDILLVLVIFLLFNENRQDDYLVLIVLGALLLT